MHLRKGCMLHKIKEATNPCFTVYARSSYLDACQWSVILTRAQIWFSDQRKTSLKIVKLHFEVLWFQCQFVRKPWIMSTKSKALPSLKRHRWKARCMRTETPHFILYFALLVPPKACDSANTLKQPPSGADCGCCGEVENDEAGGHFLRKQLVACWAHTAGWWRCKGGTDSPLHTNRQEQGCVSL